MDMDMMDTADAIDEMEEYYSTQKISKPRTPDPQQLHDDRHAVVAGDHHSSRQAKTVVDDYGAAALTLVEMS